MIDIKHIIERIKENEELARKFFEVETRILSLLNFNDLFEVLLSQMQSRFDIPHVWLSLVDKSELMPLVTMAGVLEDMRAQINVIDRKSFMELIQQNETPLLLNDELQPYFKLFPPNRKFLAKSLAIIPLSLYGNIIGSLNMADFNADRFIPGMDTSFLEQLAVKISMCLSNVTAHEKLRFMAYHDPLTGLLNRRVMEAVLEREFNRAMRYAGVLSVIFLDLDDFKGVNDRYGHDIGDDLLKLVADQMKALCREIDVVARYAGDEFVIILPETDTRDTRELMDRLKLHFSQTPLTFRADEENVSVFAKISHGIASSEEADVKSAEDLLKKADQRLYGVKKRKCEIRTSLKDSEAQASSTALENGNIILLAEKLQVIENNE